jgi:hypothetical protein
MKYIVPDELIKRKQPVAQPAPVIEDTKPKRERKIKSEIAVQKPVEDIGAEEVD